MLNNRQNGLSSIVSPIFWGMGCFGIMFTIYYFFVNRSLRLDEAMFAQSILTRDVSGILQGDFDYGQSGSLGFILIVKYLTMELGHSEMVLRLVSFVCYFANIILAMVFIKMILGVSKSSVTFALFASTWIFIQYAVDFKPYSMDITLSLTSFLLYAKYRKGSLNIWLLALIYAVLVWFSFATLFILGAICMYHLFVKTALLYKHDISWKNYKTLVLPLAIIGVSALADYVFWVKPTSSNVPEEANEYWRFLAFPLIPTSLSDVKLLWGMFIDIFIVPSSKFAFLLLFPCFLFTLWSKRKYWVTMVLGISVIMVLAASAIGMYPISARLQLFLIAFYFVYASYALELIVRNIVSNIYTRTLVFVLVVLPIVVGVFSRCRVWNSEVFHYVDDESHPLLEHYYQVRGDDGYLWVSSIAQPAVGYYLHYPFVFKSHNEKLIEKDHVIWGSTYRIMQNTEPYNFHFVKDIPKFEENINAITSHDVVYLIRTHPEGEVYDWIVDELKKYGKVSIEQQYYESILYKFEKSNANETFTKSKTE